MEANCEMFVNHYNNLGFIYMNLDSIQQAEKAFESACRLEPDNELANYNLGVVSFELGNYSTAVHCLLTAINLSKTPDLDQYIYLVDSYNAKHQYDSSRYYINEVLEIVEGNKDQIDEYLLKRASIYAEYGDYENSISAIDSVIARKPNIDITASAYFDRHLCYYMLGDSVKACEDYNYVMDLKPDCGATTLLNCR
ncbi:MAG: tetratricopeptide repeat protein [Crocinitomicaceae bacterium]|nr:tetratricopeptide repeat protein [Crocinitomicaceae bacterium]